MKYIMTNGDRKRNLKNHITEVKIYAQTVQNDQRI